MNVHPPTSVLQAIPLQGLNHWNAFWVWNLISLGPLAVSLWLVVRGLGINFLGWSLLPICLIAAVVRSATAAGDSGAA